MKISFKNTLLIFSILITLLSSYILLYEPAVGQPPPQKPQFWFFTQNPTASMYNPATSDPNYQGAGGKWDTDSVVLDEDWIGTEVKYTFWLASHQFSSTNTHLVLISNDAAPNWDVSVSINDGATVGPISWTQSMHPTLTNNDPNKDPATTDTYGYWEISIPDLTGVAEDDPCVPVKIEIFVDLKSGGTPELLYIHLRAWSDERTEGGPNSHDATAILSIPEVPETGTIIVEKQTLPDGDSTSFTFTGDAAGSIKDGEQIVVGNLQPGTYTSTETVPAGWTLTGISLDDGDSTYDLPSGTVTFELAAGETVKAIFTNTKDPETGTIIVEKQTIPEGHVQDFDFTGLGGFTLKDNEIQTITGLIPGEYTVTEIIPPGWELKDVTVDDLNSVADKSNNKVIFHIEAGETVTAVFTNEKEREPWKAKIKVRKVDSNGNPVEGWMMTLVQIDKYTDSDGYAVFQITEPGSYSILEETRTGWISLGSTMVTFDVDEERTYTHTFRNEKIPDFVIPEYPLGPILSLLTMISVLILSQNKHKIHL